MKRYGIFSPLLCVPTLFVCDSDFPLLLNDFLSHPPGSPLDSSNLLSLQDDYSSCSLHSFWYVLTTHGVLLCEGMS